MKRTGSPQNSRRGNSGNGPARAPKSKSNGQRAGNAPRPFKQSADASRARRSEGSPRSAESSRTPKREGAFHSSQRGPGKPRRPRREIQPIGQARSAAGSLFASTSWVKKPSQGKTTNEKTPQANSSKSSAADLSSSLEKGHRLQKILAAAGFGSRRECEELIVTGRVEIDGQIVTELGVRADPQTQKIRVDGELLQKTRPVYLAVNKPKGFLCTHRDQQGRRRVIDLIPPQFGRVFPIGRLDLNSEGLILLTNDGALAEHLAHPRYEVAKKYQVLVAGLVDRDLVFQMKKGIHIAEGIVQADDVSIKSRHKLSSLLEIVLREGKNREIRRMLARIGHKVLSLKRVAIGPIKLGEIPSGGFRLLTKQEVAKLYAEGKEADSFSAEE